MKEKHFLYYDDYLKMTKEEIEACQKIADDRGIYLKIRKFS